MTARTTITTITAVTAATSRAALALLLAAAIIAIAAAGSASAHGDSASHYLETDALYPSFARQPSVQAQLQLMGLLQATERRGYPIKVALVAGAEDLVDDVGMMRTPRRYANAVASTIDRDLEAPVLVVTPFGVGVSGTSLRRGVLRPLTARDARTLAAGLEVPPEPDGDDLARTAMAGVRRIARVGGKPLPALAGYRRWKPSPTASEA
jgi:F0F1-type ATP synthase membrane subunit c/vacuolar-type H+-ATPase subunit K